jgi:hypothetical protein
MMALRNVKCKLSGFDIRGEVHIVHNALIAPLYFILENPVHWA